VTRDHKHGFFARTRIPRTGPRIPRWSPRSRRPDACAVVPGSDPRGRMEAAMVGERDGNLKIAVRHHDHR
jgi:hypothetical protein